MAAQAKTTTTTAPTTSSTKDGTTTSTPGLNLPISNHPPQMPGTADLGAAAGPLIDIAGVLGEYDVNAVVRALAQLASAIWDPQSEVPTAFKRLIAHVASKAHGCQY